MAALDFSNRDPKDPNGIYSLDTTYTTPGWVKDGDWSTVYDTAAKAKAAGANNPVKMATAITNDGRRFNVILDANNKPISEIGDSIGQDDDRAAAWRQTAPKPNPPSGSPTQRQPDGSINAYNPTTGQYDIPTGTSAGTTAKEWRTEGTPDEQGGYDNSKPTMAAYVNGKRTGETRPPTAAELKDWNQAGQMTRNPGGKTDAEIQAETKAAEDKARQNAPKSDRKPVEGQPGVYLVSTTKDGKSETHFENEAGQPIQAPPNLPSTIVSSGVTYIRGANNQYAPAPGIPTPGAGRKNITAFVPDPSQPDLGISAWAEQHRSKIGLSPEQGGITQDDWDKEATAARGEATVYIQNATSNQSVRRQNEQDERDQRKDLSDQSAADYGRARSAFNNGWQYMNPNKPGISTYIPAIMEEQRRFREQREGTARPPVPLSPMFQNLAADAGVKPATGPTPPNAIGAGGIGNQPAPLLGPPPAVAPSVQASAVAAPPSPAVAPQSSLPPAVPYAPPPLDNVPPPPMASTAAPPLGQSQDASTPQDPPPMQQPGSVNPPPQPYGPLPYGQSVIPVVPSENASGLPPTVVPAALPSPGTMTPGTFYRPEPGPLPPGEVTMAPGQGGLVSAWAQPLLAPQQPAAPQPAQPGMMADVAQQAQQQPPQFDPIAAGGRLANFGVPHDVIAQALLELGMLPNQQGGA